jgi:aspartate racemase
MNRHDTIGIIGGAGVAATNKLNRIIEEQLTKNGAFRDAHHPEIITFQAVNVPSRSMFLEGKGKTFIPGYVEVGFKLKSIGATRLCMSCNTAHIAIDNIQEQVGIPFIDMIAGVVKCLKGGGHRKIGVLASDGCRRGKVYERYFDRYFPEATLVYPDLLFQKEVTKGIVNIKNKSRFLPMEHPDRPKQIFIKVCEHLYTKGVDAVISGCTDIAVDFLPEDYIKLSIIDSLTVLAHEIMQY